MFPGLSQVLLVTCLQGYHRYYKSHVSRVTTGIIGHMFLGLPQVLLVTCFRVTTGIIGQWSHVLYRVTTGIISHKIIADYTDYHSYNCNPN